MDVFLVMLALWAKLNRGTNNLANVCFIFYHFFFAFKSNCHPLILVQNSQFVEDTADMQLSSQAAFYGNSAAEPCNSIQGPLGLQPQE